MLVLSLQDLIRITIEGIKFTSEFYSSKVKSKRVVRERNVKQQNLKTSLTIAKFNYEWMLNIHKNIPFFFRS